MGDPGLKALSEQLLVHTTGLRVLKLIYIHRYDTLHDTKIGDQGESGVTGPYHRAESAGADMHT